MRMILALGNPGDRYRDSRHNVGWWLVDRLVRGWRFPAFAVEGSTAWTSGVRGSQPVELHKPRTFMNRSGDAIEALIQTRAFEPTSEMLVLVDDIALPPGRLRLRARGSAGGHNGLTSIVEALESDRFSRLRIGVGRPRDERIDLAEWVLARMPRDDEEAVLSAFTKAVDMVEYWLEHSTEATMSRFN